MNATDERNALLRCVLVQPDDDTARLVFADWLDENGEPDRAEFIRLQVELAKCPPKIRGDRRWGDLRYGVGEPWDALRQRERALWEESVTHRDLAKRPAFRWFPVPDNCTLSLDSVSPIAFIRFPGNGQDGRLDISRGFAGSLRILPGDFLAHAAALFAAHPIASVRLVGCQPEAHGGELWWYDNDGEAFDPTYPANLPDALFTCAPDYQPGYQAEMFMDEGAAHEWLSRICVRYGRSLAGLPAWEPTKGTVKA